MVSGADSGNPGAPAAVFQPGWRAVTDWVESGVLKRLTMREMRLKNLSKEDAEDISQEVALAFLRKGESFVANKTYLYQTVRHKAADIARDKRKRARRVDHRPCHPDCTEACTLLLARVASLPKSLQTYFTLRFRVGLTQQEIERATRKSRGQVRGLERRLVEGLKGRGTIRNPS
jgi:DNA-directed RNA polymerase specialized sigma24 family protein